MGRVHVRRDTYKVSVQRPEGKRQKYLDLGMKK